MQASIFKPGLAKVIKATQPMERLNLDCDGPLPSVSRTKFILKLLMNTLDFYLRYLVKMR